MSVQKRKQGIKNFLDVILSHPILSTTEFLRDFVTAREKQAFTDYQDRLEKTINEKRYILALKKQGMQKVKFGIKEIAKDIWSSMNLTQVFEDQFGRYAEFLNQEISQL